MQTPPIRAKAVAATAEARAWPTPVQHPRSDPYAQTLLRLIELERSLRPSRPAPSNADVKARFDLFKWEPTPADLAAAEATKVAAGKLAANDAYASTVYFTQPAADITTAPTTEMYAALLEQVRTAKHSIRAALYGVDGVPELIDELRAAIARGVDVKIVVDQNGDGSFTYRETEQLLTEFGPSVVRVERNDQAAIMHNKFWVFDGERVWTGSANINDSAIRKGYNNEISVLFASRNLATVFTAEHAQMWAGTFHTAKASRTPTRLPTTANGVDLACFFSPQHDALRDGIIPAINDAKKSIRLSLFHMSDVEVANALIDAKLRGVEVELILDSTGGENIYTKSNVQRLRDAGITVKVECWGGKQHMKGGSIDGNVSIVGSLNWTSSGVRKNDENCLIIKGDTGLAGAIDQDFRQKLASLPKFTAYTYPEAESLLSAGTTTDDADNDHSGGAVTFLTRNDYFRALDRVGKAASRVKHAEGLDASLAAFEEGVGFIKEEVDRVIARYGDQPELAFFIGEMRAVQKDIGSRIEMARLIHARDALNQRIFQAPLAERQALRAEQDRLQTQIDRLDTRSTLHRFNSPQSLNAKLEAYVAEQRKAPPAATLEPIAGAKAPVPGKTFNDEEWNKIFALLETDGERFGLPRRSDNSYLFASANIRKMGAIKERTAGAWAFWTKVLSRFDATNVQEVLADMSGIDAVVKHMGSSFGRYYTDTTGGDQVGGRRIGMDERMVTIFDRNRIQPEGLGSDLTVDRTSVLTTLMESSPVWIAAKESYDKQLEAWMANPSAGPKPKFKQPDVFVNFVRTPSMVSFTIEGQRIMIVNAHLEYGDTYADRRREFDALVNGVVQAARQGWTVLVGADCNLKFDKPERDIQDMRKRLGSIIEALAKEGLDFNIPHIYPHPTQGTLRTNSRASQTFDIIGMVGKAPWLPKRADNATAGSTPDGFDYGVFNFVDLFAEALHGKKFADLGADDKTQLLRRVEYDVSDHMPIWVRFPTAPTPAKSA